MHCAFLRLSNGMLVSTEPVVECSLVDTYSDDMPRRTQLTQTWH